MSICAVIGHPISHSLSPFIHAFFADFYGVDLHYEKIEGDLFNFESQVQTFFKNGGKGLNVTLPFKERAFALAAVKTERCRLAKAANTLWMSEGILHADNTDGEGFIHDLSQYIDLENKAILLIGNGGAARGVIGPLLVKSKLKVAGRNLEKLQILFNDFPGVEVSLIQALQGSFGIVINATPSSLKGELLMLPSCLWQTHPFCYDLAYAKEGLTSFVQEAQSQGCNAVDGLGMLVRQAAEAFYIWHGVRVGEEVIARLLGVMRGSSS